LDRAPALVVTFLLAGYGIIGIAGLLAPEPEGAIRDGMTGLVLFPIMASLYAAAMMLQLEFGMVRSWRPGLRQCAVVTWVGGWSALVVVGFLRQLTASGVRAALDFAGGAAFLWCLLVGLPSLLAYFRNASPRDKSGGLLDD
jgi:hypothetical protein